MDDVAIRPWRGEGRLHNYNILGGKLGQFGGEVELFGGGGGGGGGSFSCTPSLDETLTRVPGRGESVACSFLSVWVHGAIWGKIGSEIVRGSKIEQVQMTHANRLSHKHAGHETDSFLSSKKRASTKIGVTTTYMMVFCELASPSFYFQFLCSPPPFSQDQQQLECCQPSSVI